MRIPQSSRRAAKQAFHLFWLSGFTQRIHVFRHDLALFRCTIGEGVVLVERPDTLLDPVNVPIGANWR